MNTTKDKLFLGILAFILIVNMLVLFDLNQFYIRAILGFIFIITVPGLLIMLMLKIREVGFWEYLVYTVGLSVAFIMFGGLAVNWILPWVGITDKPLALYPIIMCFDIFLVAFWIIAYWRNSDLEFKPKVPKFSWLDRIFIVVPLCFPFMAVIGAFLLNNHGTNLVTMIMLGAIAVYVFLVVLLRNKLNENIFPWALWMIGLSLLLMFSMRSWYVSGIDINLEYNTFSLTEQRAFWDISNIRNTYNSMLSISILPTVLDIVTNLNSQYTIKLFLTFIFSILPPIVLLACKKNFKLHLSFLAGLFLLFQPFFLDWSSTPIRQQIAFLFFSLILLSLFSEKTDKRLRELFIIIFGCSMIVSHYSTSYIALAILLVAYALSLIYGQYENRRMRKGKLKEHEKANFNFSGKTILILLIFGFLWYSQATSTADGLVNFVQKSTNNLGRIFDEEIQSESQSLVNQINPFKSKGILTSLSDYETMINNQTLPNSYNSSDYRPQVVYPRGTNVIVSYETFSVINTAKNVLDVLIGRLFIIAGFLYLILKKPIKNKKAVLIYVSTFLTFIILVGLPFISIGYDLARAYLQILIVLSPMALIWTELFSKSKKREIILSSLLIVYFLFSSYFVFNLLGGLNISLKMNNSGLEYSRYFVHASEINSGAWLFQKHEVNSPIYSDGYASSKLLISRTENFKAFVHGTIFPQTISKNGEVYVSYLNKIEKVALMSYKKNLLSFNFPTEFLEDNKNKIYNNGGSEIFK